MQPIMLDIPEACLTSPCGCKCLTSSSSVLTCKVRRAQTPRVEIWRLVDAPECRTHIFYPANLRTTVRRQQHAPPTLTERTPERSGLASGSQARQCTDRLTSTKLASRVQENQGKCPIAHVDMFEAAKVRFWAHTTSGMYTDPRNP